MYLLHCNWDKSSTNLSISLESCTQDIPQYAILSHRWAANPQNEVTFEDMMLSTEAARKKAGFGKIEGCCAQALRHGLHWVWIDTCCIDKRNSAELSEAINSMYSWYERSERCYAYLEDVCSTDDDEEFRSSSWFTRGWTLQELIAPAEVEFFSKNWEEMGTKTGLASTLAEITGVAESALINGIHAHKASVAEKMSWGAHRQTARVEDRAYSLMGIFGVNMPTVYGEGHRAFARLQQEIIRISYDHSIFAWQRKSLTAGLLAESPDEFAHSSGCHPVDYQHFIKTFAISAPKPDFMMTNFGLHIQLPLAPVPGFDGFYVAYLACVATDREHMLDWRARFARPELEHGDDEWVAIFLRRHRGCFPRQLTRTSLQNYMLGRGIIPQAAYDTEPIWVSLNDEISPLLWMSPREQVSPFLQLPALRPEREDTITVIMEQRFRHMTILSVFPDESFSANVISLRRPNETGHSLAVMMVQTERGKGSMMVALWVAKSEILDNDQPVVKDHLFVGRGVDLESQDVSLLHDAFLTTGCTLSGGLLSTELGAPGETLCNKDGVFVSLECVGALTYRLILGPGMHSDGLIYHGGRGHLWAGWYTIQLKGDQAQIQ